MEKGDKKNNYKRYEHLYAKNYVSKDDGVHHYRWVLSINDNTGEEELVEIEIGSISNVNN